MGKRVQYSFNGIGQGVYLCFGFLPDGVDITAPEDADMARLRWRRTFSAAEANNGYQLNTYAGAGASLTAGAGIRLYYGGDEMTSTVQTSTTYGEGIYLRPDLKTDYRLGADDAVSENITTWTLDTSANRTGHFNEDVTGTYIGEGSRIWIDNKWYFIEALTAGQGEAADEVTLSHAAPSGTIQRISGMYDMIPIPLGEFTPEGIYLAEYTYVNVNNEINTIEAWMDDEYI